MEAPQKTEKVSHRTHLSLFWVYTQRKLNQQIKELHVKLWNQLLTTRQKDEKNVLCRHNEGRLTGG